MAKPDWPEIRRLAHELSSAAPGLRESLIKDDFEAGSLIPMRAQCEDLCLLLNKVLDLSDESIGGDSAEDVDGDMVTTVSQAAEAAMDLKAQLSTLINTANDLANNPGVDDRRKLERNWFEYSKETIAESRDIARLLRSLVQIIDLLASDSPTPGRTQQAN